MIELELSFNIPPGHLGWPLIGNMLAFIKDFKSGHPDSFINNLISRFLLLFLLAILVLQSSNTYILC
jgi:hypothetical protein